MLGEKENFDSYTTSTAHTVLNTFIVGYCLPYEITSSKNAYPTSSGRAIQALPITTNFKF